ncbi:MraY family glycosyltransferase [Arcticibacter tournemirensis]|nr:glycosyltransferase family 4 protein [Arcticibacter tournemirensis]
MIWDTHINILAIMVIAELVYFKIASHFNIIDKPNLRSSHKHLTLRGGGVIFLIGAWIWAVFFGLEYPWFMMGLTVIAGGSFVDDVNPLPYTVKLVFQFAAMFLMLYDMGILNWQNSWTVIAALIVCVGIINAYNFMDGINGITGGYSLAVIIPLLFINKALQFIDNNLLVVVGMSTTVFCFFNFRKKAKCFAGDVGSVAISFILLFAIGKLILHTGDFTYILFMAVYGVDTVLTICHRILLREHLGKAHRKHCYQLMANELHIPHLIVSTIYTAVQLAASFGLILIRANHWLYLSIVLTVLCGAYVFLVKKYYHLHQQYLDSLVNKLAMDSRLNVKPS